MEWDEETTAAVLELDAACEATAQAIQKCAVLVEAGRLDGNVLLLKMNELGARLMAGTT